MSKREFVGTGWFIIGLLYIVIWVLISFDFYVPSPKIVAMTAYLSFFFISMMMSKNAFDNDKKQKKLDKRGWTSDEIKEFKN